MRYFSLFYKRIFFKHLKTETGDWVKKVKKIKKNNVNTRARILTKYIKKYYNILRARIAREIKRLSEDIQQLLWTPYPYLSYYLY